MASSMRTAIFIVMIVFRIGTLLYVGMSNVYCFIQNSKLDWEKFFFWFRKETVHFAHAILLILEIA